MYHPTVESSLLGNIESGNEKRLLYNVIVYAVQYLMHAFHVSQENSTAAFSSGRCESCCAVLTL